MKKPEPLSLRQINRATLARQMLLERARVSAVAGLERLCGVQAQEAKPPFLGLWSRLAGFRHEQLSTAIRERKAVRATMMRATLHLVSAADYLALRPALQPMLTLGMRVLGARAKGLETEKLLPVARELLQEPRTFQELRPLLQRSFPKVNERALGYAVRMNLPLVMVPTPDRWAFPSVAQFALAERWLEEPLAKSSDPEALVLRYLAAFGPASAADAQAWSGLTGLKEVLEVLRPRLRTFQDPKGRELFNLPKAPRPGDDAPAPPRFLAEFDNLLLAHADRSRVIDDQHRTRVVTKNLRVLATFLWDGFVAGTWAIERKGPKAALALSPFRALPKGAADALAEEGEALLRFVETDAERFEVKVGKATVR